MYHYVHGGDIYHERFEAIREDLVDFSSNINPLGMPEAVREAMAAGIDSCIKYPDPFCRLLSEHVATFEGVKKEQLFFTNGAADFFFRLASSMKPQKALLCAPTFADYEKALNTVDCDLIFYNLSPENSFQISEDYLDYISSDINLLILCNPANPTGQILHRSLLEKILTKAASHGVTVVVDECFMDFLEEGATLTAKGYVGEFENLLVVRAFTKNFALPGVRLGYAICSDGEHIGRLRECGQDWSVSTLAQAAGIAASREQDYLIRSRKLIAEEREYLADQLKEMELEVYPSYANFMLFHMAGRADLKERLLEKGILIRSCGNYRNLGSDYYRIAVKSHEDNCKLVKAIKDLMNEKGQMGA